MALGFYACNNSESHSILTEAEDASKQMKEQEDNRWNAVLKKIRQDPALLNQLEALAPKDEYTKEFINGFKANANFIADSTARCEILIAQAYINQFKGNNPPTELSNIMGQSGLTVKRTESVWIERKAILNFANTFIKDDSIDGIRLYFAQYLDNASSVDAGIDPGNNGRKTIVFTATRLMPDGRHHVDYYKPKPKSQAKDDTTDDGMYVYDYNSLCPDSCSGATLGGGN
jgi:hypothetical protein